MIRNYLESQIDEIVEKFVQKYNVTKTHRNTKISNDIKEHCTTLLHHVINENREGIVELISKISRDNIVLKTPYTVFLHEILYLKDLLANILVENSAKDEIFEFFSLLANIENIIAKEYLDDYLKTITQNNKRRLKSLNDMSEKQFIIYYQHHLDWLNHIIDAIRENKIDLLPEVDPHLCQFGGWLDSSAKDIIKDNVKYKDIVELHQTLHDLGYIISTQLSHKDLDNNVMMSYLEKCEMISLSIGTDLALIDSISIIKKAAKDPLTGALNRSKLEQLFKTQYDLALATDKNFVLAMCDLDHFKNVNDTYGHIGGDYVLKDFVTVVQQHLRDSDLIIRFGGEEFIIILPNSNFDNGIKKLDSIREAFQRHSTQFEKQEINTTVSMGFIEIVPKNYLDVEDIEMGQYIASADEKLYKSKSSGRNRVTG